MRTLAWLAVLALGGCHFIGGVHDAEITDDPAAGGAAGGTNIGGSGGSGGSGSGTTGTGTGTGDPLGFPCVDGNGCASGLCVDDVCCDSICDGPCEACGDPMLVVGQCTPVPSGHPGYCPEPLVCGGGGDCLACGGASAPSPSPTCPAACDSCSGGTCTIACTGKKSCARNLIVCPDGYDCDVQCFDKQACQDTQVMCPNAQACDLSCVGEQACQGLTFTCGDGACALDCSGVQACQGAEVMCGWNACSASCQADPPTMIGCAGSCDCQGC